MIVFNIIMLIVLVLGIIIAYSYSEEQDLSVLLIGLSVCLGVFIIGTLIDYNGLIRDSNDKGYNVWKEETKIGDKVVKTTWHVAPKK